MTMGTMALMLIRLDARAGQAVPVADLATHYGVREELVREALQQLWDAGYARCELGADGLISTATSTGKGL
jgi:DNA-binding GntR family transcriptional regulator